MIMFVNSLLNVLIITKIVLTVPEVTDYLYNSGIGKMDGI
jgi:hypothetical protein